VSEWHGSRTTPIRCLQILGAMSLMKELVSQALYSYWNGLRGDRIAPKRFEIEPSCIASHLPDTFILERLTRDIVRFRLAGTRISEAFGVDFRGVNIFDLFDEADSLVLRQQFSLGAARGAVSVIRLKASSPAGLATDFELLLLPLTHTRESIDRFLGSLVPISNPDWLGSVALTERKLLGHETIWPDGLVGHPIAPLDGQAPFLPTVREAQIVRSDRRQFRVYEGGLSRPVTD
jgi:hypothetical protein